MDFIDRGGDCVDFIDRGGVLCGLYRQGWGTVWTL